MSEKKNGAKYVCMKCGYVYDPAQGDPGLENSAGVEFCDLPENWLCPKCKASKDKFLPEI
jgi:rubredoxin